AVAVQHRGAAVPADGPDDGLRAGRGADLRAVRAAVADEPSVPPRLFGMGEPAAADVPAAVRVRYPRDAAREVDRAGVRGRGAGGRVRAGGAPAGDRVPPLHG